MSAITPSASTTSALIDSIRGTYETEIQELRNTIIALDTQVNTLRQENTRLRLQAVVGAAGADDGFITARHLSDLPLAQPSLQSSDGTGSGTTTAKADAVVAAAPARSDSVSNTSGALAADLIHIVFDANADDQRRANDTTQSLPTDADMLLRQLTDAPITAAHVPVTPMKTPKKERRTSNDIIAIDSVDSMDSSSLPSASKRKTSPQPTPLSEKRHRADNSDVMSDSQYAALLTNALNMITNHLSEAETAMAQHQYAVAVAAFNAAKQLLLPPISTAHTTPLSPATSALVDRVRHSLSRTLSSLCSCYTKLSDFTSALDAATLMSQYFPDSHRGWYHRGRILQHLKRNEEALREYNRALQCQVADDVRAKILTYRDNVMLPVSLQPPSSATDTGHISPSPSPTPRRLQPLQATGRVSPMPRQILNDLTNATRKAQSPSSAAPAAHKTNYAGLPLITAEVIREFVGGETFERARRIITDRLVTNIKCGFSLPITLGGRVSNTKTARKYAAHDESQSAQPFLEQTIIFDAPTQDTDRRVLIREYTCTCMAGKQSRIDLVSSAPTSTMTATSNSLAASSSAMSASSGSVWRYAPCAHIGAVLIYVRDRQALGLENDDGQYMPNGGSLVTATSHTMSDDERSADFTLRNTLERRTIPSLRDELTANGQAKSADVKSVLVARVMDGRMHGALPSCTQCGAHLYEVDGVIRCHGQFDHVQHTVRPCDFVAKSSEGNIRRTQWKATA